MTTTPDMSPWGPVERAEPIANGVTLIAAAAHGGLHLTPEISTAIPLEIARSFTNGPAWPEKDVELPIALTLLIDAEKVPAPAADRFAGSFAELARRAAHAAGRYNAYPEAARPLLRILAKAKKAEATATPTGDAPADDGPQPAVEVEIDDEMTSALLTLREYAVTLTDHPNRTTDNGVHYIIENDRPAVKFGVKLAAELLMLHGYVRSTGDDRRPWANDEHD